MDSLNQTLLQSERKRCASHILRGKRSGMWSHVRQCAFSRQQLRLASRVGVFLVALGSAEISLATVGGQTAMAAESAEVEALLERGIQLRRQGSDDQALALFLQAEAGAPRSVRTMLHVATAAQAAGKWVMAAAYLKKVSRYSNDPYYRRYRDSIAQVERAIAQRVGDFIAIGGPEGATITLDGRSIGTLPMDSGVPMEAGTYTVEVSLDGYYPFTRSVAISGGSLAREVVRLVELPEEEKLALARGALGPVPEWYESSWLTWTLAGVGVVGGAASGVAFVLREEEAKEWNDTSQCLDRNDGGFRSRTEVCGGVRNDIRVLDVVMIAGGATAVAFGGMALAQWLATSPSSSVEDTAKKKRNSRASLQCSPGIAGLFCQGSF